jgi:hypothetical protein
LSSAGGASLIDPDLQRNERMTQPPAAKTVSRWGRLAPVIVVFLAAVVIVTVAIWRAGGDPLTLARLGTHFSEGDPNGTLGYDGQFIYYIARDSSPERVAPYLDVPAYRYQRILLPLLARLISFGIPDLIPWALVLLGALTITGGTWAVGELLAGWEVSRWYAVVYGLYAGFSLALIVDLPEPLAYGLVAVAILCLEREQRLAGWIALGLAVFAKETALLFVGGVWLAYLFQRRWKDLLGLMLAGVLPYAFFQGWLWIVFGAPGIGSGGALATPFEIIPYMGLLQIGAYSLPYLLAMLLVFGPAVVLPSIWGIWQGARQWLSGERNLFVACLFINSLVIAFTPFSTFRETGGILRFTCGLVLALLLYCGRYRMRKILNYTPFWLVLMVFLIK